MADNLLRPIAVHQNPLGAEIENIHRNLNLTGNANVTTVAADATLSPLHAGLVEVDTSAGAVTLTLPTAVGNVGLTYIVIVLTAGNDLELSDGATIATLTAVDDCAVVRSDGSTWIVLCDNTVAHIQSGTIDGAEIGGTSPAAGTFTQMRTTTQPCFSVYCNTAISNITAAQSYTVKFDTEDFDVGSNFNTGTYTFTAPVTGYYFLSSRVRLDQVDTAATYYRSQIVTTKKTAQTMFAGPAYAADFNYAILQIAQVFYMEVGDTAYVDVYQSGGANQTDIIASTNYTNFSGYLLG